MRSMPVCYAVSLGGVSTARSSGHLNASEGLLFLAEDGPRGPDSIRCTNNFGSIAIQSLDVLFNIFTFESVICNANF